MRCNTHQAFDVSPRRLRSVTLHSSCHVSQHTWDGDDDAADDPGRKGPSAADPNHAPDGRWLGLVLGMLVLPHVRGPGSTVGGAAGHRPRARGAVRGHRMDPRRMVADLRARDAGRGSADGPVEPLPGTRRRGRGTRRGLGARGSRPDAASRDRRSTDRWRRGGCDRDRRLRARPPPFPGGNGSARWESLQPPARRRRRAGPWWAGRSPHGWGGVPCSRSRSSRCPSCWPHRRIGARSRGSVAVSGTARPGDSTSSARPCCRYSPAR